MLFLSSSVTVALPVIAVDLGLSNIVQNWISNIFLLTVAVCSVPCGYIVSKYGIKRCMIIGILISLISCIGCTLSFSAETLISFRILQGIGCSLMNVSATLFVVEPLPIEERGKGFGISIAAVYIGLTLAPMISGFLTYHMGWQSIFYMGIPLFIIVLLILLLLIKRDWMIN
ncbi:MAG: MFS transporter [archaeon]|nr:MFS transporter [archaeon]